jgi:transposase InsO family protein
MAGKVTSMSVKAVAAVVAVGEDRGPSVNVAALCREAGVSRKTFYKWVARYRAEGLAGLEERSRRPRSSPAQTSVEVEERIVRLRKELHDAGLDHGAVTIHWHLSRHVVTDTPSVATVHRVLVRRGLVVPEPRKRPRSSWRRFEAAAPNERWQIDATEWTTATGVVPVFNLIDDHSRVAIASVAVAAATTEAAWEAFCSGAATWGLPAGVLSDNGLCFSGKLRGFEVAFEAHLRAAGVKPYTGRPYHPQTTGKVERFQQTLKQWLGHQPVAADLSGLQAQLDEFCHTYNHHRPHQGIGQATPISRWQASPARQPAPQPLPPPARPLQRSDTTIAANGVATVKSRFAIHVGVEWQHHPATIIYDDHRANLFIAGQLIRHIELEPGRRYYGTGRHPGRPPGGTKPRIPF